jgi:hypothetical protein
MTQPIWGIDNLGRLPAEIADHPQFRVLIRLHLAHLPRGIVGDPDPAAGWADAAQGAALSFNRVVLDRFGHTNLLGNLPGLRTIEFGWNWLSLLLAIPDHPSAFNII